jgi:2-methylcitrate dehydratase
LPYITAIALIDGEVTERQFQPERFTDQAIWKFLEEVTVQRNDELSSIYAKAVANIVHVTLQDGSVHTKRVDYPLGNARNPVTDEQLEGKFNSLVVPSLGEGGAQKLLEEGWNLDEAKTPNKLMQLAKMPA